MAHNLLSSGERTDDDLHRAVCSISRFFQTDTVYIIGSQSILVGHPDAPTLMRTSGEIDAYPGNAGDWEARNRGEIASEAINVMFGIGSPFHTSFGFYIDGVDENTANFPPRWDERAIVKVVKDGKKNVRVIAPCLEDLIVSKLQRLDPKDKEFIRASQQIQPLNVALIKMRLEESFPEPEIIANARGFLDAL